MNSLHKTLTLASTLASILFFSGCATKIKSTVTTNQPPSEAFINFTAFEMKPVTLAPAFADNDTNKKALAKIQENASAGMNPTLANWNAVGAAKGGTTRTLVIEPVVAEIKFIGGAARFWVGAMAGSSAVIMRVTITEKETGSTIATPEFYEVANAHTGAWTFGTTDNLMLANIANRMTDYLIKNYANAVGGVSGAP